MKHQTMIVLLLIGYELYSIITMRQIFMMFQVLIMTKLTYNCSLSSAYNVAHQQMTHLREAVDVVAAILLLVGVWFKPLTFFILTLIASSIFKQGLIIKSYRKTGPNAYETRNRRIWTVLIVDSILSLIILLGALYTVYIVRPT